MGVSAGGYGAMSMAIEHQEYFGAVATLAGALNLRYFNVDEVYFEDFDPATYRWKTRYDPNEVVGILLSWAPAVARQAVHGSRIRCR